MWRVGVPLAGPGIAGFTDVDAGPSAIYENLAKRSPPPSSVIAIQPLRGGGGNILNRMEKASRYEHLIARYGDDLFIANGQLELAGHDGHKLIRCVDEIIPLLAGRISEEITGVAPLSPVAGDLVTVWRY